MICDAKIGALCRKEGDGNWLTAMRTSALSSSSVASGASSFSMKVTAYLSTGVNYKQTISPG